MQQLFALFGAIVLIFAVLILRGVMAMPYARHRARWVRAAPPRGVEDLFEQTTHALRELGFSEPRWVLYERSDGAPTLVPLRAVYTHADGCTAWVGTPVNQRAPHRLHIYYISRLADGRAAISQAFDLYFAVAPTEEIIGRVGTEPEVAEQVAGHRAWVASLGAASVAVDDGAVLDQAADLLERHRASLIARGDLREVNENLAVPSWRYGLKLFRRVLRFPRPPDRERPIPPERLALLARVADIVRHRAPPRDVQLTLFAVSVLLFVALGALFWDVAAAITILIVVLIHELGHYLAMRVFGYRNVHLLALPLVGGVAMGVDANPSATRRAWMSLMGPLPGIVIGWALLALSWFGGLEPELSARLIPAAMVFLFINYLNVLPMPPLDGAHVVQALLPPRWGRVETVFIVMAAVVGGVMAWQFGLPLLTALAAMQLLAVPSQWRTHGVEARMARETAPSGNTSVLTLRVLRALEQGLGPASQATARINQAFALSTRLQTKPMSALSRTLTGLMYGVLLAFPVLVGVVYYQTMHMGDAAQAQFQQQRQERQALRVQAKSLSWRALLSAIPNDAAAKPEPASTDAIARAASRLGGPLPQELHAFYREQNGAPELGLLPLDEVAPIAPAQLAEMRAFGGTIDGMMRDGSDFLAVEVSLDAASAWWHLGGNDGGQLFYLPQADTRLHGQRFVAFDGATASLHADLRDWLEQWWTDLRQGEALEARRTQVLARARASMAELSVQQILEQSEPDTVLAWLLERGQVRPQPATEDQLQAAEARLAMPLPDELKALLRLRDGVPEYLILSTSDIASWPDVAQSILEQHRASVFMEFPENENGSSGQVVQQWDERDFASCLVVAGTRVENEVRGSQWVPLLLWCPPSSAMNGWLDINAHQRYARLRDWLIEQAAVRVL